MKPVRSDISFPKLELEILSYWRANSIFKKSADPQLESDKSGQNAKRPEYVFYDGPPFATGLPHYGHLLAGTIKDVVGRFFTMKGYHVDRRFGWDCHGVPVEFEIQKSLNLHGAKAIKDFGVGKFNEECRKIVLRYTKEWRLFVERSGRWVDFDREYRTMDKDFMESIWWVVQSLWKRGLIYQSVKCVPYSCGMNTPLSNFEANLNYKNVQDPAVTVKAVLRSKLPVSFKIPADARVSCLAWTTTPWTLPGNMALAVGEQIKYSLLLAKQAEKSEVYILASSLLSSVFPALGEDENLQVLGEISGAELVGLEYEPFFSYFEAERANRAFRIYSADFVSETDGTGIVHMASFGEDDLEIFKRHELTVVDTLDEAGHFKPEISEFAGMHFKAADSRIISALKHKGVLFAHRTIEHSYPFCWRTDTPLIYRSVSSWFVKVESIRDLIVHANSKINWVPSHIRDGRFGKWLENARDWAISRDRYWGTPIPIWQCEKCEKQVCLGSVSELEELSGAKVSDLHSHCIDHLTFKCDACAAEMRRIPQVLDCWFESGSMPYAQAHYPFENKQEFEQTFPADFIAEGLDQTRGWFYTLLVLSTALFGQTSFKNVIVNGIVLAEDGKKMSKSLKNYPPPDEVMEEVGADAMRLYLLSSSATRGEDLRFSKEGVKQVVRQTLLPLWNAYNFLVTYALVDSWTPADAPGTASSNLLDRWILSRVGSLITGVDRALANYHLYTAAQPILEFVEQLTNWYIRLNRRRFWVGSRGEELQDKLHAYATLHKALLYFVRVLAPLAPFVSEEIFLNLKQGMPEMKAESVHLAAFPTLEELSAGLGTSAEGLIDEKLERAMELFEEIIILGRGLRNDHNLKVRQPVAEVTIIFPKSEELNSLRQLDAYIKEELNVKRIVYSTDESRFVSLKARLNTKLLGKTLGPKLGSQGMRALQQFVEGLSSEQIKRIEQGESMQYEDIQLGAEQVLIERSTNQGTGNLVAASSGTITLVLDTQLSPELRSEGLGREFVNRVQKLRKDCHFEVTDRIVIHFMTACPRLIEAVESFEQYIKDETLALEVVLLKTESEMNTVNQGLNSPSAQEIDGKTVILSLTRLQA